MKERQAIKSLAFSGSFSASAKRFRTPDKIYEIDNGLFSDCVFNLLDSLDSSVISTVCTNKKQTKLDEYFRDF